MCSKHVIIKTKTTKNTLFGVTTLKPRMTTASDDLATAWNMPKAKKEFVKLHPQTSTPRPQLRRQRKAGGNAGRETSRERANTMSVLCPFVSMPSEQGYTNSNTQKS